MEERLGELVARRPLAAGDLLPGALVVRHVVAEPELPGTDRVEYPAGAPLDLGRDHRSAPLTRRDRAGRRAGSGSSGARRVDVRRAAGRRAASRRISVIAQRCPAPFMPDGGRRRAEQVAVGDPRQVDAAGGGEAVPLPEARVDLHELEDAVARVALELDLRDPVEPDSGGAGASPCSTTSSTQTASPTRHVPTPGRRLAQLAPAEQPERPLRPRSGSSRSV